MNVLQTLRQSRGLPMALALWLVFSLGLAVAAPQWAPVPAMEVCSASPHTTAPGDADPSGHSPGYQCVLCLPLHAAAPAVLSWSVPAPEAVAPARGNFTSASSRPALCLPPLRGPPQA